MIGMRMPSLRRFSTVPLSVSGTLRDGLEDKINQNKTEFKLINIYHGVLEFWWTNIGVCGLS